MWLISGGAYQGKLAYAQQLSGISEKDMVHGGVCNKVALQQAKLVNGFHLWIRRMMLEEKDVIASVEEIVDKNPEIIIVVDELGCGIVPMDAFERSYREMTGRICCSLARQAEQVHRVSCGIGMVIKHD